MPYQVTVKGNATNKVIAILETQKSELTLMDFLREKNIPIASSCYGEGVCHKCMINKNMISCQISLKKFIETNPDHNLTIIIDYL